MVLAIRCGLRTGAFLCLGAAGMFATAPLRGEQPDVRVKLIAPRNVAAGGSATLIVELLVGPGWHVNSHTPREKFLIPTEVALGATVGVLSAVRYPEGVDRSFAFSDEPMSVYEGTVRFESDLGVPSGASGDGAISGSLSLQACNARQCFPPAKIPLAASVSVVPSGGGPGRSSDGRGTSPLPWTP